MRHLLIESGHFRAEQAKIARLNSKMLHSAVGMVESAYWLIGGNQYAQALVMLDNAIELVLKSELERIHPLLIADARTLGDFEMLKTLLKDSFRQHPAGKDLSIADFDIERTIYLESAFDRVAELYPRLSKRWRRVLLPSRGGSDVSLHGLRNRIVHFGGERSEEGAYVAAIVEIAFPFLEDILASITGHDGEPVQLRLLLMEWIYREVDVARSVLKELNANGLPPQAYAIATLAHHIVWSYTQWPKAIEYSGGINCSRDMAWGKDAVRRGCPLGWDDSRVVEVNCPICDSDTGDGSVVPAMVLLEDAPLDENLLVPEGFHCDVCGLRIDPTDRYLARHFVQSIPPSTAQAYLKDIGRLK